MSGKAWMRSWVAVGSVFGAVAPALAQSPPPPVVVVEAEAQPVITDQAITASIKARLQDNKMLQNAQVTFFSTNGIVTVVGMVPSSFAYDDVMEAVRSTPGVLRVDDQLRINVASPSAPQQH